MSRTDIAAGHATLTPTSLTIEELRSRLKGSGLIAQSAGVYHTDHILIDGSGQDRLVVCAVAGKETDGLKMVARLKEMLADVGNVMIHTAPNSLRAG
ncbi:hypothetical protein JL100_005105 [Skermanella mucosa]|uniref:hypothetical protein n=1 Tax=Skermanella mucosa TaxID=1789672 RepID=UPI00192BF446|nr:hypothetical protein [Skermanella mucosa]UEM22132.1 hypothetical protein JL100_005105 [Skermanella mucosa]